MTELLVAIHRLGPVRAPILRKYFAWSSRGRLGKMNRSHLIASADSKTRDCRTAVIGINPNLPVYDQFAKLVDALARRYQLRNVPKEIRPSEIAAFYAGDHEPVDVEAIFGTSCRTLTLVALHALGGKETASKLGRSVLGHFSSQVKNAVSGMAEEGTLAREGSLVGFNERLDWLPELRELLDALSGRMPKVVGFAHHMKAVRQTGHSGTAHSDGQRFRFLGSRVNQAILAYLAAHGPSRITEVCAAAASCATRTAVDPLLRSGVVVQVFQQNTRETIISLNAAHPVYRELRALLRSKSVLEDALPFSVNCPLYFGDDHSEERANFEPYTLFGVAAKTASTNVLAILAHAVHGEIDGASLSRILNEHDRGKMSKALARLETLGVVATRKWKGMLMYRLDETWPAYSEIRDLLLAIGRAWPEYHDAAMSEPHTYPARRRSLEQCRVSR
ncbi:MAG TPA: hypothetical protein VFO29_11985 [Candidatus Rubrimentiphilum sp.]|nr:hypothetical protein [Candidatus Rubrimentiphilum sp.]